MLLKGNNTALAFLFAALLPVAAPQKQPPPSNPTRHRGEHSFLLLPRK